MIYFKVKGIVDRANNDFEKYFDSHTIATLISDTTLEFCDELVSIFKEEFDTTYEQIIKSLHNKDYESCELHLHTLKGAARSYGALKVFNSIEISREQISQKNFENAGNTIISMPILAANTVRVLQKINKELNS